MKLGGYEMTSHQGVLTPGESGDSIVVAGKPDESTLVWQITPMEGEPPAMPKGKDPLSDRDVAVIKRWIQEGATDDTPPSAGPAIDKDHPPVYTLPPVVTTLDYAPDGKLLAVSGYHEVLLHDPDGSQPVKRLVGLSERIESVAFSPDGKWLAVAGGTPGRFGELQVWNVEKQNLKFSVTVTHDTIYGASWSPDGSKIAFGCGDNTLRAVDANSGEQVLYQGAHDDWVLDTVFSVDGSHLVSVSRDYSMKLTEVATQRFVDNITSITPGALKGGLQSVDRHPSKDELLIGGADGIPKLYQMFRTKARQIGDDFNRIRAYEALPGRVFAVEFNKDGSLLAAGSSYDGAGQVRVFQTDDGKAVSTFEGQKGGVYALSFHPDGQNVASAGFDGMIRINEATTGRLVREFSPVPLSNADSLTAAK